MNMIVGVRVLRNNYIFYIKLISFLTILAIISIGISSSTNRTINYNIPKEERNANKYPYLTVESEIHPFQIYKKGDPGKPNNATVLLTISGKGEPIPGEKIRAPADIVFVVDCTGSMGSAIAGVKKKIGNITNELISNASDLKLGLASYTDHPGNHSGCGYEGKYGDYCDWTFKIEHNLTFNMKSFKNAVNNLTLGSGSDWPESVSDAIYNTTNNFLWRGEDVIKLAVLIGDAPGHDCENNYSKWGDYNSTGPCPHNHTMVEVVEDAVANGVIWATIGVNGNEEPSTVGWAQWNYLAEETEGKYRALGDEDIAEVIVDLVGQIIPSIDIAGKNAEIELILPSYISIINDSFEPSQVSINGKNNYTWNLGTINIGEKINITFNVESLEIGYYKPVYKCPNSKLKYFAFDGESFTNFTILSLKGLFIDVLTTNKIPIANVNGPYIVKEGEIINFDASESFDPNNDSLKYRWDFNSDGNWDTDWTYKTNITHIFGDDWYGFVTLEVQEQNTFESFSTIVSTSVIVNNIGPLVQTVNSATVNVGQTVTLFANITDPGSDDLKCEWFWGYNGLYNSNIYYNNPPNYDPYPSYDVNTRFVRDSASCTFNSSGIYNVILIVSDDDGATCIKNISIIVIDNNIPPIASLNAYPETGISPLKVSFTGSGFDIDGTIISFYWDFDDDSTITHILQNPSNASYHNLYHTFNRPGIYNVSLKVTDNNGAFDIDNEIIIVNKKPKNIEKIFSISGYVYRSHTSKGIPNVIVSNGDKVILTDSTGYYFLEVQSGIYTINVSKNGYKSTSATIIISSNITKDFYLDSEKVIIEKIGRNEELFWIWILILIIILITTIIITTIVTKRKNHSIQKSMSQNNSSVNTISSPTPKITQKSSSPTYLRSQFFNMPINKGTLPLQTIQSSSTELPSSMSTIQTTTPKQIQQSPQQSQQNLCTTCGQTLTYYTQNNRYYCHQCKKYD